MISVLTKDPSYSITDGRLFLCITLPSSKMIVTPRAVPPPSPLDVPSSSLLPSNVPADAPEHCPVSRFIAVITKRGIDESREWNPPKLEKRMHATDALTNRYVPKGPRDLILISR